MKNVLLAITLLALTIVAADDAPMTNEDVVRMFVRGESTATILAEIERRPPAFDLDEEILTEMRYAGVPAELVEAMVARQREVAPPEPEPEPVVEETSPTLTVSLRLDRGLKKQLFGKQAPALLFPTVVPEQLAAQLRLRPGAENRTVTGLGVFVACRTAYHVPDQWRSKSPLGRDFVAMPRHRMLVYQAGGEIIDKKQVPASVELGAIASETWVRFELPESLSTELDPDEAHDLVFGVAIEIGSKAYGLTLTEQTDWTVPAEGASLVAEVRQSFAGSFSAIEISLVEEPAEEN